MKLENNVVGEAVSGAIVGFKNIGFLGFVEIFIVLCTAGIFFILLFNLWLSIRKKMKICLYYIQIKMAIWELGLSC